MAVLPGNTLERYELLNRIAVGGMAEVFRAVAYGAHGFEKTLAIKRILPELAQDPEFEARFIAEAKLAVQLTHANIVQVFDFGRFAGTMFIAMEFVDGLDLAALIKKGRDAGELVPMAAAFQIAIEIARGLDFAHQQHVVHRDVSPSNILLSKAGEVKIADFGIAQAANESRVRPTGRRQIMGKWRYMSPEQTQGGNLSTRSDIFSAGAVLFEMFTGDKLFPGDEAEEITENIHKMEIPSASARRPGLPPSLDAVLARCLARDPDDRPGKPGEVVRALTEISYESSIVATALDVAEAVRNAVPPEVDPGESAPGADRRAGIDDLIRKQLGGGGGAAPEAGVGRRTAVDGDTGAAERQTEAGDADDDRAGTHTATVVRKGVDADGVTLWEIAGERKKIDDTIAAVPSAIRMGKSTGSHLAVPEDPVEADEADEAERATRSRLPVLAVAAAVVVAGGLGLWTMSRGAATGPGPIDARAAVFDAAPADAAPAAGDTTLLLDSLPPGAKVWVDGSLLPELTPTLANVDPAQPHRIEVEAEGHVRWILEDVRVDAGKSFPIKPTLVAVRATLVVATRPSGAIVEFRGRRIGMTPLTRSGLDLGRAALVIKKRGYQSRRETVELVAGEVLRIERTLVEKVVNGRIRVAIPGWAEVFYRGKRLGVVPREQITLPLGTHKIKLVHPPSGRAKTIEVKVVAEQALVYRVTW